jgi:hypothetical protein
LGFDGDLANGQFIVNVFPDILLVLNLPFEVDLDTVLYRDLGIIPTCETDMECDWHGKGHQAKCLEMLDSISDVVFLAFIERVYEKRHGFDLSETRDSSVKMVSERWHGPAFLLDRFMTMCREHRAQFWEKTERLRQQRPIHPLH